MSRCLSIAIAAAAVIMAATTSALHAQGVSWEQIDPRNGYVRVAVNHGGTVFAARFNSHTDPGETVWRSADNGTSWTRLTKYPGRMYVRAMFVAPNGSLFISGDDGTFRSNDNGDSWTPVNNGLTTVVRGNTYTQVLFAIAAKPNGDLIAATNDTLYHSEDNGDHWIAYTLSSPVGRFTNAILVLNENDILVGGYTGLYRSEDGGATWRASQSGLLDTVTLALVRDSRDTIYAGGYGGTSRSYDGGRTWNDCFAGLPATDRLTQTLAADSNGGVYAVVLLGDIRRYNNELARWVSISNGLPKDESLMSLACGSSGHLFAGTDSACYRTAIPASVAGDVSHGGATLDALPNPARTSVTITATLPSASIGEIAVYAADGRRVAVLADKRLEAGRSSFAFDAASIGSGVYRCVLRTATQVVSVPVVIAR